MEIGTIFTEYIDYSTIYSNLKKLNTPFFLPLFTCQ